MSAFDDVLSESPVRQEAHVNYRGKRYDFATDDPSAVAGELLLTDPTEMARLAKHYTTTLGREIKPQIISQARTILSSWAGENKTDEFELVKVFLKKPELFLALYKCADSVVTVDSDLMAYVMRDNRAPQDARDAANPLVASGLGKFETEESSPQDSSTS